MQKQLWQQTKYPWNLPGIGTFFDVSFLIFNYLFWRYYPELHVLSKINCNIDRFGQHYYTTLRSAENESGF